MKYKIFCSTNFYFQYNIRNCYDCLVRYHNYNGEINIFNTLYTVYIKMIFLNISFYSIIVDI